MPLGTRIGTRKLAASTLNCPRRYVSLCLFREATQLKTDSTIVHVARSKPRYVEMQSHTISAGRQSRPAVSAEADAALGTRMAAEVARGGATAVGQRSGIRFSVRRTVEYRGDARKIECVRKSFGNSIFYVHL